MVKTSRIAQPMSFTVHVMISSHTIWCAHALLNSYITVKYGGISRFLEDK